MGMTCSLRPVTNGDIDRLLREPRLIESYLGYDSGPSPKPGFFARLFGRGTRAPASAAPPAWEDRAEGDEVDVDKSWHGLHYLFTGTAWEGDAPGCYLVRGGEQIGDVDVGYGPARAVRSTEVVRFAEFLSALDRDELLRRYDSRRMKALRIYPDVWDGDNDGEEFEYLREYHEVLRDFVAAAAERRSGLLVWFS